MNKTMQRAIGLATAGLCAMLAGCAEKAPEKVIPKASAPVNPVSIETPKPPAVTFKDITKEAGITFSHVNGMAGQKLLPETMGSGVAFLDYDNDGDQDLFLVNSCYWKDKKPEAAKANPNPTQALYRNNGKGQFEDVTAAAGLALTCFGQGVAVGDYDNDGDPDLYITAVDRGYLYRNEGNGKFTDVSGPAKAEASGGWQTSAAFFDMENDGDLDLFICRYVAWTESYDLAQNFQLGGTGSGRAYGPPTAFKGMLLVLLRNEGNGRFADVSSGSGVEIKTPQYQEPYAKSLGIAPWDVDGDGLVDLAIANDTVPNYLLHNLGQGKFEEVATQAGIAFDQQGKSRGAMGIDWSHFRDDEALGLAIGNFANEMTALYVADVPESLVFSDQANLFGLGAPTQPPLKFGLFFFDYDLDGRPDLLMTNGHLENDISKIQASEKYAQAAQLYWNSGLNGRQKFLQVATEAAGADLFKPIVGRGSAYADIDNDGDLDIVMTSNGGPILLLRNEGGNTNHWVRLKLVGKTSNRDGVGAKITLEAAGQTTRRQHFPAKGYLSSCESPLTFGLGQAEKVTKITVRWPSGKTSELTNLDINKVHEIVEP